jgi:hypothetical protein
MFSVTVLVIVAIIGYFFTHGFKWGHLLCPYLSSVNHESSPKPDPQYPETSHSDCKLYHPTQAQQIHLSRMFHWEWFETPENSDHLCFGNNPVLENTNTLSICPKIRKYCEFSCICIALTYERY